VARLRVIDGNPERPDRLRGWFAVHPEWPLERDGRHWHLCDGHPQKTRYSWAELLSELERAEQNRADGTPRLYDPLDDVLGRLDE
jgi:hypothetical protein